MYDCFLPCASLFLIVNFNYKGILYVFCTTFFNVIAIFILPVFMNVFNHALFSCLADFYFTVLCTVLLNVL